MRKVLSLLFTCIFFHCISIAQTTVTYASTDIENPTHLSNNDSLIVEKTDVQPLGSYKQNSDGKFENSPNCFSIYRDYSTFITFTPTNTGWLEFLIYPIDGFSEFDWALYNYDSLQQFTNMLDTLDITTESIYLACSYYDNSKESKKYTGMKLGAPPMPRPMEPSVEVRAGSTYLLLVDNDLSNCDDPNKPGYDTSDQGYVILWGTDTNYSVGPGGFVGVNEQTLINSMAISPNPFQDKFTLTVDLKEAGELFYDVYDLQGRKIVSNASEFVHAGNNNIQINQDAVRDYAGNVLLLHLRINGDSEMIKMLKY